MNIKYYIINTLNENKYGPLSNVMDAHKQAEYIDSKYGCICAQIQRKYRRGNKIVHRQMFIE